MQKKSPNSALAITAGLFLAAYYIPFDAPRVSQAINEAFLMLGEYAREHVLFCLVPALFIAGAITVFLNQRAITRYLGPQASPAIAYGTASVSGAILAVCSCTVLPLFKGIYKKGAGLGPAVSFLYSGPAVNILAIVLSYKVFGWQLGLARMIGAIIFSIVIGLLMQAIFHAEDTKRLEESAKSAESAKPDAMFRYRKKSNERSLSQMLIYMISMIGILVFFNWADSAGSSSIWDTIFQFKYWISGGFALLLLYCLIRWFNSTDLYMWGIATRDLSLQVFPFLFGGVLIAGFLLGRPGHDALISTSYVASLVGNNSIFSNLAAAVSGAFMYFATLTEVPILQSLRGAGMADGPSLALLLAGPSLSLPSMLVIGRELGFKKTAVYVLLVIGLSTLAGSIYGALV